MKKYEEIHIQGYPICPGIAIGVPFLFVVAQENIPEFSVPEDQIENEVARYYTALTSSRNDLLFLQKRLQKEGGSEAAAILGSHLEMMHDPFMTVQMEEEIRKKGKNTEYVFSTVMGEYEKKFYRITDLFFRERLQDVQDIARRIIGHLRKNERRTLSDISNKSIVFAHELAPSDTAEASSDLIEGFVTRSGAKTSHVAIMARAKEIPFVTNVDFPPLHSISNVIVDGCSGHIILNPKEETVENYCKESKKQKRHMQSLNFSKMLETETLDGHKVNLSANIENFKELDSLRHYDCKGVGLFRTEYLFLSQDSFPSEEEQFLVYKNMVEKVGEHPYIIRTFDIGGDKLGNFHISRYEKNPNLGCRAIRLMLKEPTIFKNQIRAILRATAFGDIKILLPMISDVSELRAAKDIVEEVKQELLFRGIPFSHNIPIGCMIEVPSAAITSDILIQECDFLSIGTNDLVQYTLAVDRNNPTMSYLYTPTHPSIVRMIDMVVHSGKKYNKNVSICGEIASDARYLPLLLGLGLRDLSLSIPSLPRVKEIIRNLEVVECQRLAEYIKTMSTASEVEEVLEKKFSTIL